MTARRAPLRNDVCPQCAPAFKLGFIVLPSIPNHDACMGDVLDEDAPGGGWRCTCWCRGREKSEVRRLWVPGWSREVETA